MLARQHRSDHASLQISDINRAGYALQQALAAAAAMLTLAALGLAGLALSPRAAVGALIAGLVVLAAFAPLRRLARTLGQDLGQAYASVHGSLSEGLSALREIKSLGSEARAAVQLDQGVAGLRIPQPRFTRAQSLGQPALQVGGAAALALLIWLAVAR